MRASSGVVVALVAATLSMLVVFVGADGEPAPPEGAARLVPPQPVPELPHASPPEAKESHPRTATSPQDLLDDGATPATVLGRIVSARGEPVAAVEILLVPEWCLEVSDPPPRDADPLSRAASGRAISATNGTFRIDQPAGMSLALMLRRPGGWREKAAHIAVLPGGHFDLGDIALRETRVVMGQVRDAAGHPVVDADVLCTDGLSFDVTCFSRGMTLLADGLRDGILPDDAWLEAFAEALPQAVRTRTDAAGAFRAVVLNGDESDLFVAARAPGFTVTCLTPRDFDQARHQAIQSTLRPAPGRITGRVACTDGGTVPAGTIVSARAIIADGGPPYGRAVPVTPGGAFVLDGLLDTPHELVVAAPLRATPAPVVVEAGTEDVQLLLPEARSLVIQVSRDGQPLDRFVVMVRPAASWPWEEYPEWEERRAASPAAGALRLTELSSGWLTLQAFAVGGASLPVHLEVKQAITRKPELVILPARTVRGRVTDALSGKPVAEADVTVDVASHERLAYGATASASDGSFVLGPVPSVPLEISVTAPGRRVATQPVPADPDTPVVVELERQALVHVRIGPRLRDAIRARLVDPLDDVDDVRLVPLDGRRPREYALGPTGLDLDQLAPGRYRVELLAGAGNTTGPEFTVIAGEVVTVDL